MLSHIRVDSANTAIQANDFSGRQKNEFPTAWAEAMADNEDADYTLINGELYSILLPHANADLCPQPMIPKNQCTHTLLTQEHK